MDRKHGHKGHGCPAVFGGHSDPRFGPFEGCGSSTEGGHVSDDPRHGFHGMSAGGPEEPFGHHFGHHREGHGFHGMRGFGHEGHHFGHHRREHGLHGGHHRLNGGHWGYGFGNPWQMADTSSSSSSSSDSDSDEKKAKKFEKKQKKCYKKEAKKQQKQWKKCHQMRQWMSAPDGNVTHCTLCWHQIKPLADTEVLECGHIYHRLCLKELFRIAITGDDKKTVHCVQCKQQIDEQLFDEFQTRIAGNETIADNKKYRKIGEDFDQKYRKIGEDFEKLKVIDGKTNY